MRIQNDERRQRYNIFCDLLRLTQKHRFNKGTADEEELPFVFTLPMNEIWRRYSTYGDTGLTAQRPSFRHSG
jgi:hypothetical protein